MAREQRLQAIAVLSYPQALWRSQALRKMPQAEVWPMPLAKLCAQFLCLQVARSVLQLSSGEVLLSPKR